MPIPVKVKCLTPTATVPVKAHPTDAAFDIRADESTIVHPHQTTIVHTGIATEIPDGYWMAIFARSGLACKQGIRLANSTAVIDSQYRDEILIALHNDSDYEFYVNPGDRIAQAMILPVLETTLCQVETLDTDHDRGGGLGSTGVQ